MEYFVSKHSIVRKIWGNSDTILFIFAGASAEFALNKAVDWLYFTKRLPNDPLGRLFSTVAYAQTIVFSQRESALHAIYAMTAIHSNVEARRGEKIPDWAYRDVLFMLIDYSIRSYELIERKLSLAEKAEVFYVFNEVGNRMQLVGLPDTFERWQEMRQEHLDQNMLRGKYTIDLFRQYRKHLGFVRYRILMEAQKMVVPKRVNELLNFRSFSLFRPLIVFYKICKRINIDWLIKFLILPSDYKKEIKALDTAYYKTSN